MTLWQKIWDLMTQGGLMAAIAVGLYAWIRRKMKLLDNAVQASELERVKAEVARAVKKDECEKCKKEIIDTRHAYFDRLDTYGEKLGHIDGKLEVIVEWVKSQKGE